MILYLTHFRSLGQESKNNFILFRVQMRTRKFASEIYWLLVLSFGWENKDPKHLELSNLRHQGVSFPSFQAYFLVHLNFNLKQYQNKNLLCTLRQFFFSSFNQHTTLWMISEFQFLMITWKCRIPKMQTKAAKVVRQLKLW